MSVIAVMSQRSLEFLTVGATMNFAGSDLFEVSGVAAGHNVRAIYARGDVPSDPLIVIAVAEKGDLLPEQLREHRSAAYARMLSFAHRSAKLPLALPRGWRQFKHDNLMAFFALPQALGSSTRWIAEVFALGTQDIVFWSATESDERQALEDFTPSRLAYSSARSYWNDMRDSGLHALGDPSVSSVGVDVVLSPAPQTQGVAKARTYTQWLPDLTPRQREFVDAASDRSIRLRGPAGSGKTLTLCVKAVREVAEARRAGATIRALFVTHSWSLAGEVDQLLTALSEEGSLVEINTLPLLAVAQEILPDGMVPSDLKLIADDSLTGKIAQLAEIEEVIDEFVRGNWITYRSRESANFAERIESTDPSARRGFAWDLLVEFGCVLGADGIFPSINSEQRYIRIHRAPWMMRIETEGDKRAVHAMYGMFYQSLQARNLLTSDQLLTDFLNYLESFTWDHRRAKEGYDLIFVDEFHLFNSLERQVLRYLSRDVSSYPRIFMALDPRQSPWHMIIGSADATAGDGLAAEENPDQVRTVDIPTVHRSSPQILELIKHIHLDYANLNLDDDWNYSISEVESLATPGPVPSLFASDTFGEEEIAIYKAVSELYPRAHAGAQLALAILDEDRYGRYQAMIENIGRSGKFSIVSVTSREDLATLKYHKRGLVVGPAEYLAGLQFDSMLIAGLSGLPSNAPNLGVRRRGFLSLLYLAVSRASREVRIFANDDFGGVPEVLDRAKGAGVLGIFRTGNRS